MFDFIVDNFQKYTGNGLIMMWFLVAVIYLFLAEKKKEMRVLFVYLPVLSLAVFFNPLFARAVNVVLEGLTYWRLLWMLPVVSVLAYSLVKVYERLSGKIRYVFVAGAILLIAVSGRLVYRNPDFLPAENEYHMPESVVEICDAIRYEGREVMAVFPMELVIYVRQYDATICMPFGRERYVDPWEENRLYELMVTGETVDAEEFVREARNYKCAYIVLPRDKKITGSLETYDFKKYAEIKDYIVYKDMTVDLSY